jgi:arylsulfatase A-like enzyme
MLTGRIPPSHGVRDNGTFRLPEEAVTLAERLQAAGYQTGAFVGAEVMGRVYGLAQGFDVYDDSMQPRGLDAAAQAVRAERYADEVFGVALEWLRGAAAERPVFAFVHLYDPHAPYEKPLPGSTAPGYDGEIAYVDQELGAFLAALPAAREGRARLLVVTSDHGEGLGEHGERTHALFLYDTTLHVPLVVHWPGTLAPARVGENVGLVDLAPTVLELLGLPALEGVDGRSQVAAARGEAVAGEPRALYFESLFGQLRFGWAPLRGVRLAERKYTDAPEPELYDTQADPAEERNLLPERAAEAQPLAARVAAIGEGERSELVPSERAAAALESLGYVAAPPVDTSEGERPDPKRHIDDYERFQLAHEQFLQGEAEQALATMAGLEAVLGESPYFYLEWGNFAAQAERWPEAIAHYRRCLELDPAEQDAWLNLGVALAKTGDVAGALEQYEALLGLNPEHPTGLLQAGAVARQAGNQAAAAEYWRRFLEVAPNHPQAPEIRRALGVGG